MKQEDYDKALRKYPLANMSGKAIAVVIALSVLIFRVSMWAAFRILYTFS